MHNYIYKKGIKIMIIALIFVLGMSAMIFAVHRRYSQAESSAEHSKEVEETPADDLTKVYEPVAIETAETIEPQTTTVAETILVQETEPFVETKEIVEISTEASSFVSNFKIAETVSQMIVVSADGSRADVTMHEKTESGFWEEILTTKGWVGKMALEQPVNMIQKHRPESSRFPLRLETKITPGQLSAILKRIPLTTG